MKFKLFFLLSFFTVFNLIAQLDRSVMPKPGPAPEIKLGDYESFELDNGLKVFVIENHKLPKVTFSLIINRDPVLEGDYAGYIDVAGQLLRRGTTTRTKDQIDEEIDFIGARLNTSGKSISGSALKRHFEKLMNVFSDILLNSDFQQEELDKIKTQMISGLAAAKEEPNAIAGNLRRVLTFGKDHPYGEVVTEETVESINLDLCKQYYKKYFRPNISLLALVGDINVEEAKSLVSKYLGKWEKGEVESQKYKTPKAPVVRKVAISDRATSVQSVVMVSYPVNLKKGSEDVIKSSVMNSILGGSFSSRLNQNLRETHGYTYGAGSSLSSDKLVGSFIASATVRNSVTDSAITEIFNEMNRLRNEKVGEEELSRTKNYLTGSFSRSLERPQTIASFALSTEINNLPKDYYKNYLKNLNAVSADDVKSMAKKYLKPKNCNVIVVGNADEVAGKLKKFTLSGKIRYYDNYGNKFDPNIKKADAEITVESVIDNYINAIGGREKLLSIKDKTTTLKGNTQGTDITLTIMQKAPNKLFQELDFSVGKQQTVFDGEKGKVEGMGQVQELSGEKLEELKLQAKLYPFLYFKEQGYKLELKGIEEINGNDCYKVIVTSPIGKKQTDYYNKENGLKTREISSVNTPQGSFTQTIDLEDYKEKDGIKYASKITQDMGIQKITLEVTDVKFNSGLGDSIFKVD